VADPGHLVRGDLYVSHFQWQLPATPTNNILKVSTIMNADSYWQWFNWFWTRYKW